MSLEPVGARLSQLLGQDVIFADDCVGDGGRAVGELREGQVLLLENLRFHPRRRPTTTGSRGSWRRSARLRGRRVRDGAPRPRLDGGDGEARPAARRRLPVLAS